MKRRVGTAMVVGAGIAGIRAALDLAEIRLRGHPGGSGAAHRRHPEPARLPVSHGSLRHVPDAATGPARRRRAALPAPGAVSREHRHSALHGGHRHRGGSRRVSGDAQTAALLGGSGALRRLRPLRAGLSGGGSRQLQRRLGDAQGHLPAGAPQHPQRLRRRHGGLHALRGL